MLLEILTLLGAHTMRQLLKRNSCKSLDLNFSSLFLKWGKATSYKKGGKKWKSYRLTFKRQKNLTTSIRAEPTNIQTTETQVCNWEF